MPLVQVVADDNIAPLVLSADDMYWSSLQLNCNVRDAYDEWNLDIDACISNCDFAQEVFVSETCRGMLHLHYLSSYQTMESINDYQIILMLYT